MEDVLEALGIEPLSQRLMNQVLIPSPDNNPQARRVQTRPEMQPTLETMFGAPGERDMMRFNPLQAALDVVGGPTMAAIMAPGRVGIRAFHGSPHKFDKFDISKIGTGEGAQAYGHGLYFAENPTVAESYKGTVPNRLHPLNPRNFWTPAELPSGKGHMYEVNIRANPEQFLDWDRRISEQSPQVQQGLKAILGDAQVGNRTGEQLYRTDLPFVTGTKRATVSEPMRESGIPGIKYLDQGSRGAGQGTSNYVLFDDSIIDIVRRYGLAGVAILPPATAKVLSDHIKPVEHDPFAQEPPT